VLLVSKKTKARDFVSVIIPTFNAEERLLLLLASLENQSVKNYEVIVVDDGSTDRTCEAVTEGSQRYSVPLRYYYLDNTDIFGAGMARNYGANKAQGNILLFLDQDCVADKELIKLHLKHHHSKDVLLGYYASYQNEHENYEFSRLKNDIQYMRPILPIKEFRDQLFLDKSNGEAWKCFLSGHFSIKKKIFQNNQFDESFNRWGCEDVELGYRLHQAGTSIDFAKDCMAYHISQKNVPQSERFLNLAKSLIQMYEKHKTEEMKMYCFERFYHIPQECRDSMQLVFTNNRFELKKFDTSIFINAQNHAHIFFGKDFSDAKNCIQDIIALFESIDFDVGFVGGLGQDELVHFRKIFHELIRNLRDNKKKINLDSVRKQSFILNKLVIGPKELAVDFYNRCNTQCNFCSIFTPLMKNTKYVPLSLELNSVEKILTQAYEMGVDKIRIASDGEPLLSPDALPILNSIAHKGFELLLMTNGTMIKNDHILALNKIHTVNILMNFSAAKKSTYQTIYGGHKNNFDYAIKAIKLLYVLKLAKLKRKESVNISTTYIITNQNYLEIADYIALVKQAGADHVYFKNAILYDETKQLLISKKDMRKFKIEVLKAKSLAAQCRLSTNLDEIIKNIDDKGFQVENDIKDHSVNLPTDHCYNGWFFGRINPFGKYYVCCRETVDLGNIRNVDFKSIYFSDQMKSLLAEGATGISLDKKMWSKCNYCYHLETNKMASEWLEKK